MQSFSTSRASPLSFFVHKTIDEFLFYQRSPVTVTLCYYFFLKHFILFCQVDRYRGMSVQLTQLCVFLKSSIIFSFLTFFKKRPRSLCHSSSLLETSAYNTLPQTLVEFFYFVLPTIRTVPRSKHKSLIGFSSFSRQYF